MKYRLFAFVALSAFVLGLGGSTFADSKTRKSHAGHLVALLPASDGVVTLDVKRFFGDALPKVLGSSPTMLSKVMAHVEDIQSKSGIDLRQFDDVAIGVSARELGPKKYDVDPVVIARGAITSASIVGAVKLASNGKYREERIGERVMYVFTPKVVAAQVGAPAPAANVLSKVDEVAVSSLDERTVAVGKVARVRQTLEGRSKVSASITSLLGQNPAAVASFAAKLPTGLKAFVPMENDELGRNIDSIQYVYGYGDVTGGSALVHFTARTLQNEQAKSLHDTLAGLQMLGKAFLGGAKGADKEAIARTIDNAKFAVRANEVTVDLTVPQSDIDILVGKFGK